MPRSTNAVASLNRSEKGPTDKGYFGRGKNVYTVAVNKLEKSDCKYAYRDRKKKKGNFRSLWIQRINAGVRQYGMSYSEFMGKVTKKGIALNRKTLSRLAMNHPEAFKAIAGKSEIVFNFIRT
ncbi:MAG: 50S ribosomal protein L20 [Bacteroidales bacterium]